MKLWALQGEDEGDSFEKPLLYILDASLLVMYVTQELDDSKCELDMEPPQH